MKVLLVRHGQAVSPHFAPTDELRWLTVSGREETRGVATVLAQSGLMPTHVFTSPLVRAVQTAELLAHGLGYAGPIESVAGLAAEWGTTAQALAPLDRLPDDAVAIFVTHEPKIRSLAGRLSGRRDHPGFVTAGTALFEWNGREGHLVSALDPGETAPRPSGA